MKVTIKCKNGDMKEFKGYVDGIEIEERCKDGELVRHISIFTPDKCGDYFSTLKDVEEVHITGL